MDLSLCPREGEMSWEDWKDEQDEDWDEDDDHPALTAAERNTDMERRGW